MPRLQGYRDCWPSPAFCLIHNHSGIVSGNSGLPGNINQRGDPLLVVKASRITGDALVTAGKAKMAHAPFAQHPLSNRDWTQYSKAEHLEITKKSKSNPMASRKVSSREFDYRPTDFKANEARARHFRRMPVRGKTKSVVPKGNVQRFRTAQFAKGGVMVTAGRIIPLLGWGYYGYNITTSDDPFQMIKGDAVGFATEFYSLRPSQTAALNVAAEPVAKGASSMFTRYLTRWFPKGF